MTLYLKFEPKRWEDIELPSAEKNAAKNWIRFNELPRYINIFGPSGTGKTSLAKLIIQSKFCKNREPGTFDPCGQCEVCTHDPSEFSALAGVHWISPAPSDGLTEHKAATEAIQTLNEFPFSFGESDQNHRFVVLEEGQQLTRTTLTKFLDMGDVKGRFDNITIILLSMTPDRIDGDIFEAFRGRGQTIILRSPSEQAIKQFLKARFPLDDEVAALISTQARNYREAIGLVEKISNLFRESPEEPRPYELITPDDAAFALHSVALDIRMELWALLQTTKNRKEITVLVDDWVNEYEVDPINVIHLLLGDMREAAESFKHDIFIDKLALAYEQAAGFFNLSTFIHQLVGRDIAKQTYTHWAKRLEEQT